MNFISYYVPLNSLSPFLGQFFFHAFWNFIVFISASDCSTYFHSRSVRLYSSVKNWCQFIVYLLQQNCILYIFGWISSSFSNDSKTVKRMSVSHSSIISLPILLLLSLFVYGKSSNTTTLGQQSHKTICGMCCEYICIVNIFCIYIWSDPTWLYSVYTRYAIYHAVSMKYTLSFIPFCVFLIQFFLLVFFARTQSCSALSHWWLLWIVSFVYCCPWYRSKFMYKHMCTYDGVWRALFTFGMSAPNKETSHTARAKYAWFVWDREEFGCGAHTKTTTLSMFITNVYLSFAFTLSSVVVMN